MQGDMKGSGRAQRAREDVGEEAEKALSGRIVKRCGNHDEENSGDECEGHAKKRGPLCKKIASTKTRSAFLRERAFAYSADPPSMA